MAAGQADPGPDSELDAGAKGSQTVAAIERAADVLMYFTQVDQADLGVSDIAAGLGISKAVVHRVLASLRSRDLIKTDKHTRRYTLGPAALILGLSALNRIDIRQLALVELAALSAETNETATLSVRSGASRVYVDQVTPQRSVIMRVSIGIPFPLHAGSSSKAFLAFLPAPEIEHYLDGSLGAVTSSTQTDKVALLEELATIRASGWASSAGERQSGAASVAAPIFDGYGDVVAVLSLCGPMGRFLPERQRWVELVLAATARLSTLSGYRR
jgi:IclR family acetate operon transcriptional repressor